MASTLVWVLLFITPYIFLLAKVGMLAMPPLPELTQVLLDSFIQAGASGILSVAMGFVSALGLLKVKTSGWGRGVRLLSTLPNFVPPLFIVISAIHFFEMSGEFPFGMTGVILIHFLINWGMCTVLIERWIRADLGRAWELALVEGASLRSFYYHGIFKSLKKPLFSIFTFVFSLSVSGFTVPLLAGEVRPLSLSVYLFNKLRLEGDWSQALFVGLVESLLLFTFVFLKFKKSAPAENELSSHHLAKLSLPAVAWGPAVVALFLLLSDFFGLMRGFGLLLADHHLLKVFSAALFNSFILGGVVGLLVLGFYAFFLWRGVESKLDSFFRFFGVPSPVLFGFFIILFLPDRGMYLLALPLGLFYLLTPTLYRMYGASIVERLQAQRATAQTLGASKSQIFFKVLWPQALSSVCWVAGIAAFWGAGDFALSRILLGTDRTLALMVESLLGTYRLDQAMAVSTAMLAVGLICFALFVGVGNVLSSKRI